MEKTFKRLLSFAVALVMVLGLLPVTQLEVKAATDDTYTKDLVWVTEPGEDGTGGTAVCPVCGGNAVEWVPMDANFAAHTSSNPEKTAKTHYYIPDPEGGKGGTVVNSKLPGTGSGDFFLYLANETDNVKFSETCIHLNGNNFTFNGVIWMGGGDLNIMGTGTLSGNYNGESVNNQPYRAGTINIHSYYSNVNIYGGTISNHSANAHTASVSVTTNTAGTVASVTMHGGRIEKGVNVGAMKFIMNGGSISGGVQVAPVHTASNSAPANATPIYAESGKSSATFEMNGGTIEGGNVRVVGGDIRTGQTATFTMNGGTIQNGNGQPTLQITRCRVGTDTTTYTKETIDTANNGGNVYVKSGTKGAATFKMTNGTITGGTVTGGNGGNIYVSDDTTEWSLNSNNAVVDVVNTTLSITGGTIEKGKAIPTVTYTASSNTTTASDGLGGNIYHWNANNATKTTTYGATDSAVKLNIRDGQAYAGGNIYHTDRPDKKFTYTGADGKSASVTAAGKELLEIKNNVTVSGGKALTATDGTHSIKTGCTGGNINTNYQTTIYGTVTGGKSDYFGGNISNAGTLILGNGALVTLGESASHGGNIYGGWRVTLNRGSEVSFGTAGGSGGNIYSAGNKVNQAWTGATVKNGTAQQGGNAYFYSIAGDTVTMTDCTIKDGVATGGTSSWHGAGNLYCGNRTYEFNNCTFSGGVCNTQSGGNLTFTQSGIATFNNCTISGGETKTDGKLGSNLYVTGGHATLNNCTVYGGKGTTAQIYAGGIIAGEKDTDALVINGGTIGNAESKDTDVLHASGSYTRVTINDVTAYGQIQVDSTAAMTVNHGKFTSAIADKHVATGSTLAQKTGEFYEVHVQDTAVDGVPTDKTCTTDGYTTYTCGYSNTDLGLSCTDTYQIAGEKASHEPVAQQGKEADHKEDGYKAYWFCDECDTYFADEACTETIGDAAALESWKTGAGKLDKIAHTFDQKNTDEKYLKDAATCTSKAVYYMSCTCGEKTEDATFEDGELAAHTWGEEIPAKNATCMATGNVAYYDCANCDAYAVGEEKTIKSMDEITLAIDPNAHSYGQWEKTDTTHKRVCEYNAEHVQTGEHVYENGVCVCGKEEPVEDKAAQVGDTKYETLQAAVNAAKENGGVVKLLNPAEVQGDLEIPSKVKLDLGGQKLTVKGYVMAVFTDTFITDSSTDRSGRLVADVSQLRLLDNNPQLPVKMADGIMFVNATSGNQKKEGKNYQCWIDSADAQLINALTGKNASELELEFQVAITWGNNVLKYTFKDETVKTYMADWKNLAMFLTITGAEGIDDLQYQARIVFADDTDGEVVVWAGDIVNHS